MEQGRARVARAIELTLSVLTVVVGLMVVGLAVSSFRQSPATAGREQPDLGTSLRGTEIDAGRLISSRDDTRVVIVEFSDFQCRFCRIFSREQFPLVWKELVDSGKADYAFRHFPLNVVHPQALAAADAAECAGEQGRFWDMHEALFSPTLAPEAIGSEVRRLGLDAPAFERCLHGDVRTRVLADLEEGKRLGIFGTPTFLVGLKQANGRVKVVEVIEGARGVAAFTSAVNAALAQQL